MASTLAIPHFINYPGTIPGALPGSIPGSLPPVTVPVNPPFTPGNLPVTSANGVSNFSNLPVPTVQVPVVPVGGGCYNDGMEVVWHGEFSRLFSNFYPPHVWYLTITNQAPQYKWKFHRDSAKVRFCCQDCGNGWTSMKGRVTFWFYLDYDNNSGFVQFKLYGQQCKKCNSGKFEYVMWYPEEVSKVMCNVYNKVGQTYYGFLQPPIRIDRRPGRPRNQHNAELCQACRDGECDQARPVKPLFNVNGLVHAPLSIPAPPLTNGTTNTPASHSSAHTSPDPSRSGSSPVSLANSPPLQSKVSICEAGNKPGLIASSNSGLITTPVTLSSGVQPILTYSVMGTPPKTTSLTVASTHFVPQSLPLPPVNGHYIYHQTPPHLLNGPIPLHPSAVFPMMPPKPVYAPENKTSVQNAAIASITNGLEATKITPTSKQASSQPGTAVNLQNGKENNNLEAKKSTQEQG